MWRSQNLDDTNETAAAFLTFQGLSLKSILDLNFRSKIQAKEKKIQPFMPHPCNVPKMFWSYPCLTQVFCTGLNVDLCLCLNKTFSAIPKDDLYLIKSSFGIILDQP